MRRQRFLAYRAPWPSVAGIWEGWFFEPNSPLPAIATGRWVRFSPPASGETHSRRSTGDLDSPAESASAQDDGEAEGGGWTKYRPPPHTHPRPGRYACSKSEAHVFTISFGLNRAYLDF